MSQFPEPTKWHKTHKWKDLQWANNTWKHLQWANRTPENKNCPACVDWYTATTNLSKHVWSVQIIMALVASAFAFLFVTSAIEAHLFLKILVTVYLIAASYRIINRLIGSYLYLFIDKRGYLHCHKELFFTRNATTNEMKYYRQEIHFMDELMCKVNRDEDEITEVIFRIAVDGIFKKCGCILHHIPNIAFLNNPEDNWQFKLAAGKIRLNTRLSKIRDHIEMDPLEAIPVLTCVKDMRSALNDACAENPAVAELNRLSAKLAEEQSLHFDFGFRIVRLLEEMKSLKSRARTRAIVEVQARLEEILSHENEINLSNWKAIVKHTRKASVQPRNKKARKV